jgi:hypothetical protein
MKFSNELGIASVRRARRAIMGAVGRPPSGSDVQSDSFPEWAQRRGVFVTLRTYPTVQLRGCIGYPRAVLPLGEAIDDAAVAAAIDDPRFPPVTWSELGRLVVEVSLLSAPEPIAASDVEGRRAAVVVGRDGLIVSAGGASGLLLPQVAVEEGWDAEEFLERTGEKAGLGPSAWRLASTRVERFEAAVFGEVAPGGDVVPERVDSSAEGSSGRRRAPSAR